METEWKDFVGKDYEKLDSVFNNMLKVFAPAETQYAHKIDSKLRAYIEALTTYAHAEARGFVSVFMSQNYIAATHYPRLLADCCLRAYAAVVLDTEELARYLDKYFRPGGKPDKQKKGKGYVDSKFLKEQIQDHYPCVVTAYEQGHESVHFSRYHYHDFLDSSISVADYVNSFSEEEKEKLVREMISLQYALYQIIGEIVERQGVAAADWLFHFASGVRMMKDAELGKDGSGVVCLGWVGMRVVYDYVRAYLTDYRRLKKHHKEKAKLLGNDTKFEFPKMRYKGTAQLFWSEEYKCKRYLKAIEKHIREAGENSLEQCKVLWVFGTFKKEAPHAGLPVLDNRKWNYTDADFEIVII